MQETMSRKKVSYIVILILLSITLGAFSSPARANQLGQNSGAEQEVRKLERAWLDAYEQHDAKAMGTIVADDFVITFPDGSMQTKLQIMDSIKTPPVNPSRFYTEDVKARVYGETVILMGRVVSEYRREDKVIKEQYRYTDTYVKRQGRWQVVASHLSRTPEKKAPTPNVPSNSGSGRN